MFLGLDSHMASLFTKFRRTIYAFVSSPLGKALLTFLLTAFSISILSWALVNLYAFMCAEFSWWGAIRAVFMLGSPTCMFINFIQFELAKHYTLFWGAAAASFVAWALQ
jgi:hypothetical protein